jgi:hypothetical protein
MEKERLQQLAGINEIKINNPGSSRIPLDKFKKMIFEGWKNIINDLEFEQPEIALDDFNDKLMNINDKYEFCEKTQSFLDEYGFGEDQLIIIVANTLII